MSDSQTALEALIERGNRLTEANDLAGARTCFEAACQQNPASATALFGLGTVCYRQEDDAGAIEALSKAVKFAPDTPEIWNNLGAAYGRSGNTRLAISAFSSVCRLRPDHAPAAVNLARMCLKENRTEEAERWLRHAHDIRPNHAETLRLLAEARLRMGQPELARRAADQSLGLDGKTVETRLTLGKTLLAVRNLSGARECFEYVLEHQPNHPEATYYLAETEEKAGRIDVARNLFDQILDQDIDPSFRTMLRLKRALALPVISDSAESIDRDRARIKESLVSVPRDPVDDPYTAGGFTNFYLAYHGQNDRLLQQEVARFYLDVCPDLASVAPHIGQRRPEGRFKVAILSSFLRSHTVGYLCRGLIEHLDRRRFHVTLLRSPILPLEDPVAPQIAALADDVVDLPDSLPAARSMVAAVEADLLYFPEIGMEDIVYFLAFARSAPVQVMGWGHPVTSGIPNVDVFLSVKDMEPDDAPDHYRERLISLNGSSLCVASPADGEPADKKAFGMDPGAPAFLCAQSLFKIHPDFDAVVGEILRRDETAKLYFLSIRTDSDDVFLARLERSLGSMMNRVKILPRVPTKDFVTFLKSADVLLDVPHWSGGKTSLDGLAAGTPIVHWPGAFMRGRHTSAFYRRMGVMDCVVDSANEYVETAIKLVHDTAFRESVRAKISEKAPALFDDTSAIDEISDVFETLILEAYQTA